MTINRSDIKESSSVRNRVCSQVPFYEKLFKGMENILSILVLKLVWRGTIIWKHFVSNLSFCFNSYAQAWTISDFVNFENSTSELNLINLCATSQNSPKGHPSKML